MWSLKVIYDFVLWQFDEYYSLTSKMSLTSDINPLAVRDTELRKQQIARPERDVV